MNAPLFEVTLRKYEPPEGGLDKKIRFFLLSMGLIRPGDEKSPLEKIFKTLLVNGETSVTELAGLTGVTESAVRYHLERLKALRLAEGRKNYKIAEADLGVAFKVFRRYVLEEILDRIENYVEAISGSSAQKV